MWSEATEKKYLFCQFVIRAKQVDMGIRVGHTHVPMKKSKITCSDIGIYVNLNLKVSFILTLLPKNDSSVDKKKEIEGEKTKINLRFFYFTQFLKQL